MKNIYLKYWHCYAGLILLTFCTAFLMGCDAHEKQKNKEPDIIQKGAENIVLDDCWLIEVSDTKKFTYFIPNSSGGSIDMTATLYFIAWKEGGSDMFGKYEGRALVTFDMDLSKAGTNTVKYTGGTMNDSISDSISFELLKMQPETISAKGEDIDLAPLAKFVGQAEILTDEYSISQKTWKAMADGQVKLDVNSGFGDGERNPQGFSLKAGEDTVLISVNDFVAAYQLDAFSGMITKVDKQSEPLSWFRDKVMSRMEERLALSEKPNNQNTPTAPDSTASQGGLTVDSKGREGIDTNGDGKLDIYLSENGKTWADFDGDGKYEIVGEDGSDMSGN